MSNDPNKPSSGDSENEGAEGVFDAVKAAEELAASLGIESAPAGGQATAAYEETLERELEELNAFIDQKDAIIGQKDAMIAKLKTALAKAEEGREAAQDDIERVSARIVKEELKKREQKMRKTLIQFVEILDDFGRAFEANKTATDAEGILAGVEIVRKSFVKNLADAGVTHYPSLGERFDPALHDAVSLVPTKEKAQDGVVVAVVLEGYKIGEEILRPARVAVGKKS